MANFWKRPRAKRNRNRRALARNKQRLTGALIPSIIDFTTPYIDITFPQRFVLDGIPAWLTNTTKLPISATMTSPSVVRLTYDTPGSVTSVTIPTQDPALRSFTGGYVPAGTFPAT